MKRTRASHIKCFTLCYFAVCLLSLIIGGVPHRASARALAPKTAAQAAVLNLSVVPADRAAYVLRALFPGVRITVDAHANAVLVVASPEQIEQMRAIVAGIDVRNPTAAQTAVLTLHAIKPSSIANRIWELYPHARVSIVSSRDILIRASPNDLADIKAIVASLDIAPVTPAPTMEPADSIRAIVARPRDLARALERQIPHLRASVSGASVILVGSADDILKAKTLAGAIDSPAFGTQYTQVYRLHNVDATSVADLITRSFPRLKIVVDKDLNAISVFGTAADQQRISSAIASLDANDSAAGGAGSAPAYGSGNIDVIDLESAMPGQNGSPSTSAADIANAVQQLLQPMAPDLHIAVPANSSQILLAGSPGSIRLARELISRLDRAQPLVVLDTEVLEIDENVARNIGLELGQTVLSSTFTEVQPTPDPFTGQPGRIARLQPFTRSALQFTAALNLQVQKGNARVLADPRVTTISGHTATIRAGDTIAIITQTGGGVGTPVTQQLQTFNTGVTLDITPQVGPSGSITVALHPIVNSLEGILNGVPQIATRDTQTVVQLQDNQTLVIGGLIQETLQHSISKIPFLGDIPLVGRIFQNSDVESRRNELIIVVTPHVIKPGAQAPPPNAVLPVPTPAALPTLPANATLPPAGSVPQPSIPTPHPEPSPTIVPTPGAPAVSVATTGPVPTPTAFSSTNVFTFGSPPPNTYASDTDVPQIFYAQFSPTVIRNGTSVQIFAVTTTNVKRVTVGYTGYMTSLAQVAPAKWQATYNFNGSGLLPGQNPVNLTMNAYRNDGTATTIYIPVSIAP